MTRPFSSLKGLGPRSEGMLAQVGIHTVEALLASDPYEVYARLKATVPGTSLNALYALIGAIEDRHWLDIKRERKGEILMRLEDMGLAPR
ncbi:TfoX/Sxy family DNA transformation protein [Massilia endophytica]|uniref:TfoX/Sxy family DNA transformation protein n=1 Tax=Massilia endophytica TaxID=2899220 RepID=UPI001E50B8B5|nr:TfoX/Sxy family DNA transformation protein [Massilia endophytica]UGQ45351.1 TfoX/Sxy family protein [Massilia endophytica]